MRRPARRLAVLVALAAMAACGASPRDPLPSASSTTGRFRVLVFTRTTGFRHASVPDGVAAVRSLGGSAGFDVDATEDPAAFTDARLRRYAAVVFLSTTGDVLGPPGQAAFERYIRGGGGYVGVHAASDTEFGWPFYGRVVGAYFARHPAVQPARLTVEDPTHVSTRALPSPWMRTDEWYDFRANPRAGVHVLLTLDEASYSGGRMGADHPVAWCHEIEGGRGWYTALGHTKESYAEAAFLDHLRGGIAYAAGRSGC